MGALPEAVRKVDFLRLVTFSEKSKFLEEVKLFDLVRVVAEVPAEELLKGLMLEVLVKLSRLIYIRSCTLLKIKEEPVIEEDEEPEDYELRERRYEFWSKLPMDNLLFDKRFLPNVVINGVTPDEKRVGITDLLKVMLKIIESELRLEEVAEKLPEVSIEEYMEEVKNYLEKVKSFKFMQFLKSKAVELKADVRKVVYYFLSVLFLSYYRICYLVQNTEEDDIEVVLI